LLSMHAAGDSKSTLIQSARAHSSFRLMMSRELNFMCRPGRAAESRSGRIISSDGARRRERQPRPGRGPIELLVAPEPSSMWMMRVAGPETKNTGDPLQPVRPEPRTRAAVDFQDDERSFLDRSSGGVPAYSAQQPLGRGGSMAWPRGRPARLDPRTGRGAGVQGRGKLVSGDRLRELPRRRPPVPEPRCGRPLDRRPGATGRTWSPTRTPGPESSIRSLGEDLNAEGQRAT
jgi:hypothetical protein